MRHRIIRIIIPLLSILYMDISMASAQTVWRGPQIIFTKADGSDWLLKENQDSLTNNVILTRGDSKSLFNIAQESQYNDQTDLSPIDTEWAIGHSDTLDKLTFSYWEEANGRLKPELNQNLVLHLITDDIYIDLKYLSWSGGMNGGFSYIRSSPTPLLQVAEGFYSYGLDTITNCDRVLVRNNEGIIQYQALPPELQFRLSDTEDNKEYTNAQKSNGQNVLLDLCGLVEIEQLDTVQNESFIVVYQSDNTLALRRIQSNNSQALTRNHQGYDNNSFNIVQSTHSTIEINGKIRLPHLIETEDEEYVIVALSNGSWGQMSISSIIQNQKSKNDIK